MAATLTGTPEVVTWASGADPAGQSITIPSDATAVYMFWAYFNATTGQGLSSATLNSASPNQTHEITNTGSSETGSGVAVWYSPSTGSQTLDPAWDAAPAEGPVCIVAYVKGGNTTSWTGVGSNNNPTDPSFTLSPTASGDLVLRYEQKYGATPDLADGWSNAQTDAGNNGEYSRLSYITASGSSQTVITGGVNYNTIVAVSIPEGAAGPSIPPLAGRHIANLMGA